MDNKSYDDEFKPSKSNIYFEIRLIDDFRKIEGIDQIGDEDLKIKFLNTKK